MPLPVFAPALAPWALRAAAAGATALIVWQAARSARLSQARPRDAEDALDAVADGLELGWSRDAHRARADARGAWRGVVRFGADGPGVAVDLSGLARLRVASVPARRRRAR